MSQPVITPRQDWKPVEDNGNVTKPWYLFFQAVTGAITEFINNAVFGKSALMHPGAIPKVTAAGTLGESGLTDNGTFVDSTEPVHIDTGATTNDAHILMRANGQGALSAICRAADNSQVVFDAYREGGVNIAADTTASRIVKNADMLRIQIASGLTPGSPVAAFLEAVTLDLATGDCGFGGNATPAEALDATGNANVSGVYKVAGTQVLGPRLAAVTAPSITTTGVLLTAGATYTSNEQNMLNGLKAAVNQLNADVMSLQTAVNDLRSRLSTTGITA